MFAWIKRTARRVFSALRPVVKFVVRGVAIAVATEVIFNAFQMYSAAKAVHAIVPAVLDNKMPYGSYEVKPRMFRKTEINRI